MEGKVPTNRANLRFSRVLVAASQLLVLAGIALLLVEASGLTSLASASASPGTRDTDAFAVPRAQEATDGKHSPPWAWTGEAYGIGATEAVLAGYVNPGGLRTEYRFQYGLNKQYGTLAPEIVEEVVVGNRKLEVEAAIDRLKPRTTYHFRIVATNRLGKVYGKDETFTTKRRTRSSTH